MASSLSSKPLDMIDSTRSQRLAIVGWLCGFNAPTTAVDRAVQPNVIVEVEINESVAETEAAHAVLTIVSGPSPAVNVPTVQFWTGNRNTLQELLTSQLRIVTEDRR